MPPPLEDDSDMEEISVPVRARDASLKKEDTDSDAPRTKRRSASVKNGSNGSEPDELEAGEDEDEDDDEEDEDGEEDVYVIEAIKKHMVDEDGSLKFQVKWEGWDKKADLTWEPEDTLREDAPEVLDAYLESVGGREAVLDQSTKATKGKKRGRQPGSGAGAAAKRARNGAHPADSPAPATAKKFTPPPGSWEDLVENIEASQDEGTGKLMVYLTWKSGHKTRHETNIVHKKLPQKMCQFYERHIRIIPGPGGSSVDEE
ncbi:chromo shadow domain-containing protein [Sarocladium implicatum]|nr:chromo shadow domain-containing protein [Sarocladium implicatum]